MMAMNSVANKKSPLTGFHTGNYNTLFTEPKANGVDIVKELRT